MTLTLECGRDAAFEPAGQDGRRDARVVQFPDQVRRARSKFDLLERPTGVGLGESLEQSRPFAEALGVADLVVHRAFGDLCHLVGDVDALAEQHGHFGVR